MVMLFSYIRAFAEKMFFLGGFLLAFGNVKFKTSDRNVINNVQGCLGYIFMIKWIGACTFGGQATFFFKKMVFLINFLLPIFRGVGQG